MLAKRVFLGAALLATGSRAATSSSDATETASSTSSATDGPQTHEVNVGLPLHQYGPDEIEANPGDTVKFIFYPPNHSVIRAAFGYPCVPWEYIYEDGDPFYSGVREVATRDDTTTFEIVVNNTEPIFYYCGAPGSCLDEGMIGVINPNKTETLQMQKDARDDFDIVLIPGDPWPEEGNPMATVSNLAITETGGATATATSDAGDDDDHDHHDTLGAAQIAGIAIGGAALLVIVGALVYFCGRRGGLEKGYRKSGYIGPQGGQQQGAQPQMAESTYPTESPNMSKHVPSGVPSVHYGLGMNNPVSPPMSPGMSTMQSGHFVPGMTGPYQYQGQMSPPPAEIQTSAPVELPASADPGNSPLPQYSNQAGNTYSWAPREEAGYRPSEKS